MQLTEHFSLEELTASEIALRKGLDNIPSDDVIENLRLLAGYLERIRSVLGKPMHVNSAYRSPDVNAAVGGAHTSAHLCDRPGRAAADFVCPEFGDPRDVILALAGANIPFDQLIYEGTWVHYGIDGGMRGQVLTAHFANGGVTYTEGVA